MDHPTARPKSPGRKTLKSLIQALQVLPLRNPDDDEEMGFEAELAAFENSEEMDQTLLMGDGPENQQTSERWSRPPPPELDPSRDSLEFQQLDVENYLGQPLPGMPGAQIGPVPVVRMYVQQGVTHYPAYPGVAVANGPHGTEKICG